MCVLSKKLAPDKRGVASTGRAVEDPNGGASFLANLRQQPQPSETGPPWPGGLGGLQAGCSRQMRVRVYGRGHGGYIPRAISNSRYAHMPMRVCIPAFPQLKSRRAPRKFAGAESRGVRLLAMAPAFVHTRKRQGD